MCDDGVISWIVEFQPPSILIQFGRLLTGPVDNLLRQAGHLCLAGCVKMPGVRRVLDVLIEFGLRRRELLHQLLVSRFLFVRQRHTGKPEVPQFLLHEHAHRGRRVLWHGVGDLLVSLLELLVV